MFASKRFLAEHFHNPAQAERVLSAYGFPVKLSAVEKWWQRGNIPGKWWPVLIAIREIETGAEVGLARYLEGARRDEV